MSRTRPLELTREQILSYRRSVQALDERLPWGQRSLRRAAWAGLQDSMPRAALLSIHARVEKTGPSTLEDPSLVQLWGPRFSAYAVAKRDVAVFSLGRHPEDERTKRVSEDLAARLRAFLGRGKMPYGDAGRGLGEPPNRLRYAATTGTVLIRWDGARGSTIWTIPPPEIDPDEARLELARRYLRFFGPATAEAFAEWAGVAPARARATFAALARSLTAARTPVGHGWMLASDEPLFRKPAGPAESARLLPSGDTYFLRQGADRELLVPDAARRRTLWTPRVWPGAVLLRGEIVGTWRRSGANVAIEPWRRPTRQERALIEAEGESLPLPDLPGPIRVRWVTP